MKKNKIIFVVSIVLVLVLAIVVGSIKASRNQEQTFAEDLLNGVGVGINNPPQEYSDEFAERIINKLVTDKERASLVSDGFVPGEPKSILFDYGDRGKTLSLQNYFDQRPPTTFINVTVDRKDGIQLRHQIIIGTDLSSWELIKKESGKSDDPFQRVYVLVQSRGNNGRMMGLSFYEGSLVQIEYGGLVNENTISNLVEITWNMAKRQVVIYDDFLKEISEGPLFKGNPVLTRPDLPNPDNDT